MVVSSKHLRIHFPIKPRKNPRQIQLRGLGLRSKNVRVPTWKEGSALLASNRMLAFSSLSRFYGQTPSKVVSFVSQIPLTLVGWKGVGRKVEYKGKQYLVGAEAAVPVRGSKLPKMVLYLFK